VDHAPPNGMGVEDYDLDVPSMSQTAQGSQATAELLEEYDVDTVFSGHFHGSGGEVQMMHGTDVVNVGPGQYVETGYNEEDIEYGFYGQTEWGAEPYSRSREPNQDSQAGYRDVVQRYEEMLGQDEVELEDIESNIETQVDEAVEQGELDEETAEQQKRILKSAAREAADQPVSQEGGDRSTEAGGGERTAAGA
jgi:hypothetical protein